MRIMLVSAIALAAAATPAAAQNNYDGFRAEARIGYETPTISLEGDDDRYELGNAVSYGGEIGLDIAVSPSVTVGPYASLEESNVELEDDAEGVTLDVGSNRQLGGRVGFGLGGLLGYVKLGYSDLKLSIEDGEGFRLSDRASGIGGGFGLEGNFGRSTYYGVEVNYSDFGETEGVGLQRGQVAGKIGIRL